jgi:hypothetical protein
VVPNLDILSALHSWPWAMGRSMLPIKPDVRPIGLRGAWVVAARCCAGIVERSFGMSKGKRARSAKTRSTSKVRAKASLSEDESRSIIPSKSDSRGRLKCRLSPPRS